MQAQQDKQVIHFRRSVNSPIHNRSRQYEPLVASRNDEVTAKLSLQQQRKLLIKGKIKNRIGQIIRNKKSIDMPRKQETWRKDSEFSVSEVVQKHNMNTLRKKYMEYLERGFQTANEVRIGGAAKLHEPLYSDKAVESLIADAQLKRFRKEQLERKQQLIHSNSRPPSSKYQPEPNLDNMMSPIRAERRPFTAGMKPEQNIFLEKSFLAEQVKPNFTIKHTRNLSSEGVDNYLMSLAKKRETANVSSMRNTQKRLPRHSLPMRQPNDIRPWEEFEEEGLQLEQS